MNNFIFLLVVGFGCIVPSWCKCKEPINIYDDLKCSPIYKHSSDQRHKRCPLAFDCSHIRNDNNKCFYNGVYYKVGAIINEYDQNLPSCVLNCTCNSNLEFDCRVYSCPWSPPPPGCYATYNLRRCCSNGNHCPCDPTLSCRGKSEYPPFKYGEVFESPTVDCAICECYPGYTGKPNDPHCKKAICDSELYNSLLYQNFCAIEYLWKSECCPNSLICPSPEDIWEDHDDDDDSSCTSSSSSSDDDDDDYKCRYGDRFYEIGTKFKRKEDYPGYDLYSRCECTLPPYFTCERDPYPGDDD